MKVFLSSTAEDLTEYRKVADDTILRLSEHSIAMERFGPLPGMPVEECERLARECDVLVCIVAHRYGFIPEKGRGSITRIEVEAAHKAEKDVLVWIVADDYAWTEKKEQDLLADPNVLADPAKIANVTEGIAGLLDFKAWLLRTFTPERFTTPDDLGRKAAVALANYTAGHSAPVIPRDQISIARLPTSGAELFGRDIELELLDESWANTNANVLCFVAWGGVGKTALINHWLKRRMARDNYRGADRVYAWSFFNQGSNERSASPDLFLDHALRWFGDTDPTVGSPWDKGERLARYIRQSRTLLILDGLEPLQHPPGPNEGRLKDIAMQALLVELAAQQPGLCLISTRQRLNDLLEFENGTVVQHDLEQLSARAGAQILRSLNVRGDDEGLEQAARELDGHAFSLTLLGSYLDEVLNGDIQRRGEIQNLFHDTRYGDAAQRMIAAYEEWLGDGMELAILRLVGLFNRPADLPTIEALRRPPAIEGLTEPLQRFKDREWHQAVAKLRRIKLLGGAPSNEMVTLDAHPLVREHFKQQLKVDRLVAWREANSRIYEHLKNTTKEYPNTIEEMSPLYSAVAHGCAAGRYEEALGEVYSKRIQRGDLAFNWHVLSAYGADLTTLAGFFDRLWDLPVPSLPEIAKSFVLNEAGVDLRCLGRLQEAVRSIEAGLEITLALKNWQHAARIATNLSDLYLAIGDLREALKVVEEGVKNADRTTDVLVRTAINASLGDVLHRQGLVDEATAAFEKAEALLNEGSEVRFLHSWWGFLYCDLLLTKGDVAQVKKRILVTLRKSTEQNTPSLMGLDYLSLGRARMLETKQTEAGDAAPEQLLTQAVRLLRQGGQIDRLVSGLLARAALYVQTAEFSLAVRDLGEVFRIAHSCGMGLHLADFHLESARLSVKQNNDDKALEHLATAKDMINRIGYHRRDKEVQELEAQLA